MCIKKIRAAPLPDAYNMRCMHSKKLVFFGENPPSQNVQVTPQPISQKLMMADSKILQCPENRRQQLHAPTTPRSPSRLLRAEEIGEAGHAWRLRFLSVFVCSHISHKLKVNPSTIFFYSESQRTEEHFNVRSTIPALLGAEI